MATSDMTLDHVRGIVIGAAALAVLLCVLLWPGCATDGGDVRDDESGALESPASPHTRTRPRHARPTVPR
jgi:hypothetical protein